jgi:hypothetical protein
MINRSVKGCQAGLKYRPLESIDKRCAMGDIQKECLPHPLTPLLRPLGMTRWAEAADALDKYQDHGKSERGLADRGEVSDALDDQGDDQVH